MYILYESYTDDYVYSKELISNTKIIALYNNKEQAINRYNNLAKETITQNDSNFDWFVKELEVDLLNNTNIIMACNVYNGGIENYKDNYMIILEEIEVLNND